MFSSIGLPEILIICIAILILFGGRKIPQLARDLGTGIREFKRSLTNAKNDMDDMSDMGDVLVEENAVPKNTVKRRPLSKTVKKTGKKSNKKSYARTRKG